MSIKLKVLGVSGSLRSASLNTRFLEALRLITPSQIDFEIYRDLSLIPPFNFDLAETPPPAVLEWKTQWNKADIIILASPEYAAGVSGALKNALDWLVGDERLAGKAIAFPNLSIRANIAQENLAETLKMMSLNVIEECSTSATHQAPLMDIKLNSEELVIDPKIGGSLQSLWENIEAWGNAYKLQLRKE